jgi:hypothetical protein
VIPFFVLAIGLMLIGVVNTLVQPLEELTRAYQGQVVTERIAVIGDAIQQHYLEVPNGGFLTPTAIAQADGYQYVGSYKPAMFQTAKADNLNDTAWRFSRVAIYFQYPGSILTPQDYLAASNNGCGSSAFTGGESWCGPSMSAWLRLETKASYTTMLLSEKQRLYRTMRKFLQRYSADSMFTSMPEGSVQTLAGLVGYNGTAIACSGVWVYSGIPFTCDDLFNSWGIPIAVNQPTVKRLALVNRTGITVSSGQAVRIAEEVTLE